MKPERRPSNKRIANSVAVVAFAVTFAVLALTGFAVAKLDPGRTTGPHLGLALLVLVGASTIVALLARLLTALVLKNARPDA
jgi:hypothetical protein